MSNAVLSGRRMGLGALRATLQAQQERAHDVIVAHRDLEMVGGDLVIAGMDEPTLSAEGVSVSRTALSPTQVFDGHVAEKFKIPAQYVRRMREENEHGLLSENVNTWLRRTPGDRCLLRTFRAAGEEPGIARAMLSDRYRVDYNLDITTAILYGIRDTGVRAQVVQSDLTERRMYLRVHAPEVRVLARQLLRGYRSPFTGQSGADCPVVFAGFVVSNSEVGHGRYSIVPELTVEVCGNGMTFTQDAIGEVHLGARRDVGEVRWSRDTQEAMNTALRKQARDAVAQFLDPAYVEAKLAEIEDAAAIRVREVPATLEHVGKQFRFSQAEQDVIFEHFIRGGDVTAGGVLHAVTSAAQVIEDADAAHELQRHGVPAMNLAAMFQS